MVGYAGLFEVPRGVKVFLGIHERPPRGDTFVAFTGVNLIGAIKMYFLLPSTYAPTGGNGAAFPGYSVGFSSFLPYAMGSPDGTEWSSARTGIFLSLLLAVQVVSVHVSLWLTTRVALRCRGRGSSSGYMPCGHHRPLRYTIRRSGLSRVLVVSCWQ